MIGRFVKWCRNFIKYIRRGGVVYTQISTIRYNEVLKGKTALITGGSSGFGYAIASKFLSEGANVIITGRNKQKLDNAVKSLINVCERKDAVKGMTWDLIDVGITKQNLEKAINFYGQIDIFINNAGVWCPQKSLSIHEQTYDSILDTNLKGLFFLLQEEALYLMKNKIKGKIINTTSVEGIQTGFAPYSASKWGANNLTIGLAKQMASQGTTVNAIAPGIALTEINQDLKEISGDNDYCPTHRTGRYVKVEEVAELATFLASDAANNITGQIIAIDGGWTLR